MKKGLLLLVLLGLCVSTVSAFERPISPAMQEWLDRAKAEMSRIVPLEMVKYLPENALPARGYHLYRFIKQVEGSMLDEDLRYTAKQHTSFYLEKQIVTTEEWDSGAWVNSVRSTITFDANGMPLEFFNEQWKNGLWQPVRRSTFTYDVSGNAITNIVEADLGGTGTLMLLSKWTATVDGNGFVTVILYQTWSGAEWMDNARDLFSNDASGRPVETTYQIWSGDWENFTHYLSSYDNNGNSIEDIHQFWNGSTWENADRYTSSYNAWNMPDWNLYQSWDGSSWVNGLQRLFDYDGAGNRTSWTDQNWNGSGWDNDMRGLYTYSGSDITEFIQQVYDVSSWVNDYRETYSYPTAKVAATGNYKWPETEIGSFWNVSTWEFNWRVDRTFYDIYNPHVETYKDYNSGTSGWDNSSRNTFEYIESTGVDDDIVIPESFTLSNYPNPFNPETTIQFTLPEAAEVTLTIYDITGTLIRKLKDNAGYSAGSHRLVWDGLDNEGRNVASGVYLYRLQSERFTETKRCVLMK